VQRETTNRIRFFLEELLPPMLHDSRLFRLFAQAVWGRYLIDLANFRARAATLSDREYEELYRAYPKVYDATSNSAACLERISRDIVGTTLCDVGCGTGYLLKQILATHPEISTATGIDFAVDDAASLQKITYLAAKIEDMPLGDAEFDTVLCTHVIEHILDYRRAIEELRRITKRRLIIVVPREREALYTFNPHFNFFPYTHSFLRAMHPLPQHYTCVGIGRDIYYCEDRYPQPESESRMRDAAVSPGLSESKNSVRFSSDKAVIFGTSV
jgi:SAM-dependent methyltransferase